MEKQARRRFRTVSAKLQQTTSLFLSFVRLRRGGRPVGAKKQSSSGRPCAWEFEHAIVFSTFSEALSLRRSKSGWGMLLRIEPLRVDDALHPTRIVYQLKPSSTMRQRWEFRDTFKNLLGRDRRLVSDAMRLRKRDFLAQLTEASAQIIRNQLDLGPEEFWRVVRQGELRSGRDPWIYEATGRAYQGLSFGL